MLSILFYTQTDLGMTTPCSPFRTVHISRQRHLFIIIIIIIIIDHVIIHSQDMDEKDANETNGDCLQRGFENSAAIVAIVTPRYGQTQWTHRQVGLLPIETSKWN
jgi:hypothetical protein